MARTPSAIDQIANAHLEWIATHSPSFATYIGRPGAEDQLDDESPTAHAEANAHAREVLAQLANTEALDDTDRVTKDAMTRTLELDVATYESGMWRNNLNVIASPAQGIRDIFDLSPTATEGDWENLAKRMLAVSDAVAGYIECLQAGIDANDTPARRQVEQVAKQAADIAAADGFFVQFAEGAKAGETELSNELKGRLAEAANAATAAYGRLESFLKNELLPAARSDDAIGRERYALLSQSFVGSKLDLDETYEWGIQELARVAAEQEKVANQIKPGATVAEASARCRSCPQASLHR
jgi:uncharacterized protein (DUF885 family)